MNEKVLVFLIILILLFTLDFVYVSPTNVQKRVRIQVTYLRLIGGLPVFLIPFFGIAAIVLVFLYAAKLWYVGEPEKMFWDWRELELMESQIIEGMSKSEAYISTIRMIIHG